MAQVEGSTLVARALAAQGTGAVFTVVGGPVIEAVGACGDHGVRPIGCHHEQAAVMMATAYWYTGGKPAAALLASGPAVTNGVTGAHVAWDNCWPIVILGGSSSQRQRGKMPFQEADSVAMMRPVTKWAVQVDSTARIPELIALAFRHATAGRPGPVYVDLPADVLQGTVDDESVVIPAAAPPTGPAPDPEAVQRAAELLLAAERPLLLLGKGVRWSEPYAALRELVERLGMPFLPSPMGRGSIPNDHPLCFSSARSLAMRGADVVVVLGARLNWMFGMGRALAPEAKIIQVDIEPEEIGLHRPATVGIVADAGRFLGAMLEELDGKTDGLAERANEGPWLAALREHREKNERAIEPLMESDAAPMTHHRMLKEVRDRLPREAVVTVDGQIVLAAGRQVIPSYTPASRLNSGSNGCMGVGVPFAVGAKLALPDRTVVSINGDCAFGFNGWEVETSLRYNAPVLFVVDNNEGIMGGVLEGRMFQHEHPERVAMYQPGIRYDKLGEAFGAHGEHVETPDELAPALERALAAGRSAVVNVRVDPAAIWPIPTAGRASSLMGY